MEAALTEGPISPTLTHLKQKLKLKTETELKKINCNKRGKNLWQEWEQELKKILARPKN